MFPSVSTFLSLAVDINIVLGCLQYVRQIIKKNARFWIALLSSLLESFYFSLLDCNLRMHANTNVGVNNQNTLSRPR